MNYCNKCKHYGFNYSVNIPTCNRPIGKKEDKVYGFIPIFDERNSELIRQDETSCGEEGKFFEPQIGPHKDAELEKLIQKSQAKEKNKLVMLFLAGMAVGAFVAIGLLGR